MYVVVFSVGVSIGVLSYVDDDDVNMHIHTEGGYTYTLRGGDVFLFFFSFLVSA